MTTFQDGPARGQTLQLKRTPFLLRVVECAGKIDALDQPEDTPHAAEKIYVYEWAAKPMGGVHIRASGGRGGFFGMADYKLSPEQPPDDVVRDNGKWVTWCETNVEAKRRYDFFMSIK